MRNLKPTQNSFGKFIHISCLVLRVEYTKSILPHQSPEFILFKYILFKFTFNNWQTINTPRYFNQSGCVILVYMSPGYQIVCVWNAKLILCTETVNVTYKIDIIYIYFGVKN